MNIYKVEDYYIAAKDMSEAVKEYERCLLPIALSTTDQISISYIAYVGSEQIKKYLYIFKRNIVVYDLDTVISPCKTMANSFEEACAEYKGIDFSEMKSYPIWNAK
jgi:hypothetical protein